MRELAPSYELASFEPHNSLITQKTVIKTAFCIIGGSSRIRLDKIYFLYFFFCKFYLRALVPIGSLRGVITTLLAGELRLLR